MKIKEFGYTQQYVCKKCDGYIISRFNNNLELELFCQSCGRSVKSNIEIKYSGDTK